MAVAPHVLEAAGLPRPGRLSRLRESIVIVYVLFLDYYVSGLTAGAVKG